MEPFLYKLLRYELVNLTIKICLFILMYVHICTNQRIFVYAHVSVSVSVSVCICERVHLCLCEYIPVNIHMPHIYDRCLNRWYFVVKHKTHTHIYAQTYAHSHSNSHSSIHVYTHSLTLKRIITLSHTLCLRLLHLLLLL